MVGTSAHLSEHGIDSDPLADAAAHFQSEGRTVVWVAAAGAVAGVIAIADIVRDEAAEVISELRDRGLDLVLLTGDNPEAARTIAGEVGIERVLAGVLPGDKADEIRALQTSVDGLVGMVGDGINDAPALARADLGMAMGSGADVAMETAQVTLMSGGLRAIPRALSLSRATVRVIRQNLFWAFAYNVILIPVAAGVLYPLPWAPAFLRSLHPVLAALAMALSSVTVVSNSLRLRKA